MSLSKFIIVGFISLLFSLTCKGENLFIGECAPSGFSLACNGKKELLIMAENNQTPEPQTLEPELISACETLPWFNQKICFETAQKQKLSPKDITNCGTWFPDKWGDDIQKVCLQNIVERPRFVQACSKWTPLINQKFCILLAHRITSNPEIVKACGDFDGGSSQVVCMRAVLGLDNSIIPNPEIIRACNLLRNLRKSSLCIKVVHELRLSPKVIKACVKQTNFFIISPRLDLSCLEKAALEKKAYLKSLLKKEK